MTNNNDGKLTVSAHINGTERHCTSRFAAGERVRVIKRGSRFGEIVTVRSINGSFGHAASATFTYVCDPFQGIAYEQLDLSPVESEEA